VKVAIQDLGHLSNSYLGCVTRFSPLLRKHS